MVFRKNINGLRAIAVLAVVIFHFLPARLPGGFVGVDVFFVISGYLMTAIIFLGIEKHTFTLWQFYQARARRIIPALAVLVAAVLIFGWISLTPEDYVKLGKHAGSSLLFLSNFIYVNESGYFDMDAHDKWLLHTWSLSVEWQFYLVYPVLLLGLKRLLNRNQVTALLVVVCVAGVGYSYYLSRQNPDAAFYLLPARAWEMLLGGLAFLVPLRHYTLTRWLLTYIELPALLIILVACVFISEADLWPGYLALVPALGAYLIINGDDRYSLLANSRLLQFVGSISYSVYLWHWPLVVYLNQSAQSHSSLAIAIGIMASFILGWLSYVLVENKFRGASKAVQHRSVVAIVLVLVGFSFAAISLQGFKQLRPNQGYYQTIDKLVMPNRDNGYCFFDFNESDELALDPQVAPCLLGNKKVKPKGLLFGDSYAGHYEPFWDKLLAKRQLSVNAVTTNWCYPALGNGFTVSKHHIAYRQCQYNRAFVERHLRDYRFIILAGSWLDIDKHKAMPETFALADKALAAGLQVIFMASPIRYDTDVLRRYQSALYSDFEFDVEDMPRTKDKAALRANKRLAQYAASHDGVYLVTRDDIFGGEESYLLAGEQIPYSLDGKHISLEGAQQAALGFEKSEHFKQLLINLRAGKVIAK